jgi:hypothetical protein
LKAGTLFRLGYIIYQVVVVGRLLPRDVYAFTCTTITSWAAYRTLTVLGPGALSTAGGEIKKLGLKNALIVTDAVLHKIGATKPLTDLLTNLGIAFTLFDGCEPNPTVDQVRD